MNKNQKTLTPKARKLVKIHYLLKDSKFSLSKRIEIMGNLLSKCDIKTFLSFNSFFKKTAIYNFEQDISWLHFFPSKGDLPPSSFFFDSPESLKVKQDWEEKMNIQQFINIINEKYKPVLTNKNKSLKDGLVINEYREDFINSYIKTISNHFPDYLDRVVFHRIILDHLEPVVSNSLISDLNTYRGSNIICWLG